MVDLQECVAIVVAVVCALFVLRDFTKPFLSESGCGSCGGCKPERKPILSIAPAKDRVL